MSLCPHSLRDHWRRHGDVSEAREEIVSLLCRNEADDDGVAPCEASRSEVHELQTKIRAD